MAVYERVWRRWDGRTTPQRTRFLVVTRYAIREAFRSRAFTAFYASCVLPVLVGVFLVYLSHNLDLLRQVAVPPEFLRQLTQSFFEGLFAFQAVPAFFVAVIVMPSLVAPDLANNGLPLYLCRPITRVDYVVGKIAVLAVLLSPVTWMGGLLVWTLQAYLEGGGWWADNLRIAIAYLVGHVTWILVISLLSLAVSAWVRIKPLARAALIGMFFILGGMAEAVNAVTRSHWGEVIDIVQCIFVVVASLFGASLPSGLPVWAAVASLATVSLLSILLLHRKLRAHEEVR